MHIFCIIPVTSERLDFTQVAMAIVGAILCVLFELRFEAEETAQHCK